jgi:glycosyltransferase involved in cell wall biosynthesis
MSTMQRSHNVKLECEETIFNYPLITVGIPTYNGSRKIENAVMSVLKQGYPNVEILISDNGSTDNTQEVCLELARKIPCVRYFRQPQNIGWVANFQFVLSHATGDFFMWLCDDDALEPGIVTKYVDFLQHNPDYSLVSGQIRYWDGDRTVLCERDFNFEQSSGVKRLLYFYFKVVHGAIFYGMMRKGVAQKVPLANRMGVDWHFVASIAYFGKIKNLDCIGYHKAFGGISRNFKDYAKSIGATSFAWRFPYVQIARDAFSNILYHSPVYAHQQYFVKMILAFFSFLSIIMNYYGKQYPFILGGEIKRFLGLKTSRDKYRTV